MLRCKVLLCAVFSLALFATASGQQEVQGDCNTVGNTLAPGAVINIHCPGLRPHVLAELRREIADLKLSVDDTLKEANKIARRYREYEVILSKLPVQSPQLEKAWGELDRLNLAAVEALLRELGVPAVAENAVQEVLDRAVKLRASNDIGQVEALQTLLKLGRRFDGRDLNGVYLAGGVYEGASFPKAELRAVNFNDARATNADLSGTSLSWSTFQRARFDKSRFRSAFAGFVLGEGASFVSIDGSDSTWFGADLRNADFSEADLRLANFQFSDLRGAKFNGAKLQGAFFVGTDLTGATFDGAEFQATDFTATTIDASQLSPDQRSQACRTGVGDRGALTGIFRIGLKSFILSPRFASGKEFRDEYDDWVRFPLDYTGLPLCPLRTPLPSSWLPTFSTQEPQELRDELSFYLSGEVLNRNGRLTEFRSRMQTHLDMVRRRIKKGHFLHTLAPPTLPPDPLPETARIPPLALTAQGGKLILAAIKYRDARDRIPDQTLVTLGAHMIGQERERWKSLKESANYLQVAELREGGENNFHTTPIVWQAISAKGSRSQQRAFVEALLTNQLRLRDLLKGERCVSDKDHTCVIGFFIFDPRHDSNRDPRFVAFENIESLRTLFTAFLAYSPEILPHEVSLIVSSVDPVSRDLKLTYTNQMNFQPFMLPKNAQLQHNVYALGDSWSGIRGSSGVNRPVRPEPSMEKRTDYSRSNLDEIATDIANFKGWTCREYFSAPNLPHIRGFKFPASDHEKVVNAARGRNGTILATIGLRDTKMVYDVDHDRQDCVYLADIADVSLVDTSGALLASIPVKQREPTK